MSEYSDFESIPIGLDMEAVEVTLDANIADDRLGVDQWWAGELVGKLSIAGPLTSIDQHPRMRFAKLPDLPASIWAKSEHEFLKPMKMGSRILIRGKIVDKDVKRGSNYIVSEFEAVDETGEVLLRSRETFVSNIEEEKHGKYREDSKIR